mmetsp:Transcript_1370/g.2596  ORF Transcript_1370/g.2596 Transcript_1370/m.2596 type:complete len:93 (+) Transcript_1370:288-566(+)
MGMCAYTVPHRNEGGVQGGPYLPYKRGVNGDCCADAFGDDTVDEGAELDADPYSDRDSDEELDNRLSVSSISTRRALSLAFSSVSAFVKVFL